MIWPFSLFKKKRQEVRDQKQELKRQETFERIRKVIMREFKVPENEKVTLESRVKEDLQLDSVDAIQLVMALEEEFDFELPDQDAENLMTVAQIVDYIQERLQKKSST